MEFIVANSDYIDIVTSLESSCFKHPFAKKDVAYELSENPFSHTLLLKIDEEIVGYLIYWITFDSATINRIGVIDKARNKGYASLLIKESEKYLKKENVEFYTLEVRESNIAAINLYKKNGFSIITKKIKYYEDGENALYMMKGEI